MNLSEASFWCLRQRVGVVWLSQQLDEEQIPERDLSLADGCQAQRLGEALAGLRAFSS